MDTRGSLLSGAGDLSLQHMDSELWRLDSVVVALGLSSRGAGAR